VSWVARKSCPDEGGDDSSLHEVCILVNLFAFNGTVNAYQVLNAMAPDASCFNKSESSNG
jgi:hypothetical protein